MGDKNPKIQERWEKILRQTVRQFMKQDKPVVVNQVRSKAEENIEGISQGFFKAHEIWKGKSKDIINDEFEKQQEAVSSSAAPSPEKKKNPNAVEKTQKAVKKAVNGRKKKLEEGMQKPKKRKRTRESSKEQDTNSSNLSNSAESCIADIADNVPLGVLEADLPEKLPEPTNQFDHGPGTMIKEGIAKQEEAAAEAATDSDAPDCGKEGSKFKTRPSGRDIIDRGPIKKKSFKKRNSVPDAGIDENSDDEAAAQDASDSEMSVLIDEDPKPRKRKSDAQTKTTKEPKKKPSNVKEPPPHADPEAEEIKLLQRRLVKCGIRKMWFKELAPYDTAKAKVRHLNNMLSEAGMKGRYSDEKAAKIREERELKQDLEAVQEGNKMWGQDENSEPEAERGRPKRKLAKGLAEIQHLIDDGPSDDDEW